VSGPWIQTAVVCEQVAGDAAGKLTASDIVDGVAIEGGSQVELDLLIALVRGDWQGAIQLHVVAYDPEGNPISAMDVEGDPPAIPYAVSRIVVPIQLVPGQPGVYWFDLSIEERTITRIPLRVDWR
jgi:hypothetical protein